jgi:hypothetical protein
MSILTFSVAFLSSSSSLTNLFLAYKGGLITMISSKPYTRLGAFASVFTFISIEKFISLSNKAHESNKKLFIFASFGSRGISGRISL